MISPEVLRRFPIFAGLSAEAFKDIAQMCGEKNFEDGMYLFEEGDEADFIYLVLAGKVDLLMNVDLYGKERTDIETIVEGELLGWSTIVEPHVYRMSGIALGDVKAVAIDAANFREYLYEKPTTGLIVMMRMASVIGERLTKMRLRFMSLVTKA